MDTITVTLQPAPDSPLNLRLGTAYAPRVPSPGFAGFECYERARDHFVIVGYTTAGERRDLFAGPLVMAYRLLATFLGMVAAS